MNIDIEYTGSYQHFVEGSNLEEKENLCQCMRRDSCVRSGGTSICEFATMRTDVVPFFCSLKIPA